MRQQNYHPLAWSACCVWQLSQSGARGCQGGGGGGGGQGRRAGYLAGSPSGIAEVEPLSCCSAYSSTIGRTTKPFNPLLGETYELIYPEKGFRRVCTLLFWGLHTSDQPQELIGRMSVVQICCGEGGAPPHRHCCALRGPQVSCCLPCLGWAGAR